MPSPSASGPSAIPRAMMRDPITVEDVLNSRLICWPVHLLECCLVTDGGGALVMIRAERASEHPKKPVYVLGMGESVEMSMISQMHDFSSSARLCHERPRGIQGGSVSTIATSIT